MSPTWRRCSLSSGLCRRTDHCRSRHEPLEGIRIRGDGYRCPGPGGHRRPQEQEHDGRRLTVNEAKPREPRSGGGGGYGGGRGGGGGYGGGGGGWRRQPLLIAVGNGQVRGLPTGRAPSFVLLRHPNIRNPRGRRLGPTTPVIPKSRVRAKSAPACFCVRRYSHAPGPAPGTSGLPLT